MVCFANPNFAQAKPKPQPNYEGLKHIDKSLCFEKSYQTLL